MTQPKRKSPRMEGFDYNAVVPRYVGTLKRFCNRQCGVSLWQRSFDDRIIRNDRMYERVWNYIDQNPIQWALDRYYI